ncbi:MAG: CinA family nicotinamide mononucleotide deamidase-related protein [Chloroflexi bacterium]|nr:CinA family nicotinamide mononucleotide deamidase-related protein [Chloroflexota bacterium]
MRAEIVSVGTELLLGMITDTNAQYLTQQLADIGVDVYWISQVGDNLPRVVEVLDRAFSRSDAVIVTGGLGPTEDDLTREAIAELMGETMVVDAELERQLRENFARRGRPMPERGVKQATLIPSAKALSNPIGTAPGWLVERNGHAIAAMPGVPAEMRLMWTEQVRPVLRERAGASVLVTSTLRILGIGESGVEERLGSLVRGTNPTVATYAKPDGVQVRISAKGADEAAARELLSPLVREVRNLFGENVFGGGDESPGALVGAQLRRIGWRLASAESGTGGVLVAEIAGDPALAPYFRGGLVMGEAGDPFGLDGASAPEMALAARAKTASEAGIAILVRGEEPVASSAVSVNDVSDTVTTSWSRGRADLSRRAAIEALAMLLRVLKRAG